jgi:hypothetical protein
MTSLNPFATSLPVRFVYEIENQLFVLPFDACTLESHDFANRITSQPVESGATVTDHVIIEPDRLRLSGVYSNTPLPKLADVFAAQSPISIGGTATVLGQNPLQPRRAETLFEELHRLREEKTLVTVFTNLREYENMVIVNLSVPRDAARGGSVFAEVELQEIAFVASETVDEVTIGGPAQGTKNKGKKAAKDANDAESEAVGEQRSFLISTID